MKNTRIFRAKSALDQPSTENNLAFKAVLMNAEIYYKNRIIPAPNATPIINFIEGKTSEIDNLYMSFVPTRCSEAGKALSEERKTLSIHASKNGKSVTIFHMDEKVHTAETLQLAAHSLASALLRKIFNEFDWVEEYELDLTKFSFIGLLNFMELKMRTQTYEEFVKSENVLPILPAIPEDYLNGNHVAMLRNGNRNLQITCLGGFVRLQLNF